MRQINLLFPLSLLLSRYGVKQYLGIYFQGDGQQTETNNLFGLLIKRIYPLTTNQEDAKARFFDVFHIYGRSLIGQKSLLMLMLAVQQLFQMRMFPFITNFMIILFSGFICKFARLVNTIYNYTLYQIKSMAQTSNSQTNFSRIRGCNFEGFIDFTSDSLRLSLTEFKKGGTFCCEITNQILEKDPRRFFIFRQIDDLFIELITNNQLQISDGRLLIIPIQINYKGKTLGFKLELEIFQPIFEKESDRLEWFYKQIDQMHKFYNKLQAEKANWTQEKTQFQRQIFQHQHFKLNSSSISVPQLIKFKQDPTNSKSAFFQVDKDKVRVVGSTAQYTAYNHCEALPKSGIFYFKFKVLRTAAKEILAGIYGKNIKNEVAANLITNPFIMALNFKNSHYHAKSAALNLSSTVQFDISEATVFKVEINFKANCLTWFANEQPLYLTQIPKELDDVYIYPCLIMHTIADTVEFVNK